MMKHLVWHYLDALNQWRGPISDQDLDRLLSVRDTQIWREGWPRGVMGSEYFAQDGVPELRTRGKDTDAHGQPRNFYYNAGLPSEQKSVRGSGRVIRSVRAAKSMDELLGVIRGVLLDGEVSEKEVRALSQWCDKYPEVAAEWPSREIAARLDAILADGLVTNEEREDLAALLAKASGEEAEIPGQRKSTTLPLCDPAPEVLFANRTFVLTGQFVTGTRANCEAEVIRRGGRCASGMSKRVDFLVIGELCSRDWAHTTYGRKIEAGVDLRSNGAPLRIVGEEHWAAALRSSPRVL